MEYEKFSTVIVWLVSRQNLFLFVVCHMSQISFAVKAAPAVIIGLSEWTLKLPRALYCFSEAPKTQMDGSFHVQNLIFPLTREQRKIRQFKWKLWTLFKAGLHLQINYCNCLFWPGATAVLRQIILRSFQRQTRNIMNLWVTYLKNLIA